MSEVKPGIDRRSLVKGAAWSVPVVAAAVATPLAAASVTRNNLAVETVNCNLVTLDILGSNTPGFQYTVTEGVIPAGTVIEVTFGGAAAISIGNFELSDVSGISLLQIGGNTATFQLNRDYAEGEKFTIGLTGFTVNIVGHYTTRIITPDAVADDNIAAMTTGGVGLGGLIGAFICFDQDNDNMDAVLLDFNVAISVQDCRAVGLGGAPYFRISAVGGTIPQGTRFLMYSSSVASISAGTWTVGGSGNLDLLGLGSRAWQFELPRDVTPSSPLDVRFNGVGVFANQNWYLAFIGEDTNPIDNAAGMEVWGAQVGPLAVTLCQVQTDNS